MSPTPFYASTRTIKPNPDRESKECLKLRLALCFVLLFFPVLGRLARYLGANLTYLAIAIFSLVLLLSSLQIIGDPAAHDGLSFTKVVPVGVASTHFEFPVSIGGPVIV